MNSFSIAVHAIYRIAYGYDDAHVSRSAAVHDALLRITFLSYVEKSLHNAAYRITYVSKKGCELSFFLLPNACLAFCIKASTNFMDLFDFDFDILSMFEPKSMLISMPFVMKVFSCRYWNTFIFTCAWGEKSKSLLISWWH